MTEITQTEALDARQIDVLEAMVERMIPTDEYGPGAREARVTRYIEKALATDYASHVEAYRAGLSATEAHATAAYGQSFTSLPGERQDAVLRQMETEGFNGALPAFFELVRRHAIEGMFGDPKYGGNAHQVGWALLSYPGPRPVWTEADQQLGSAL